MDRAREFHYVKQMPRRTTAEVDQQDATYDRQVLLNESWDHYVTRLGRTDEVGEPREKRVTESWAEYEERVAEQAEYLADYAAQQDAVADADARREAERRAGCERRVAQYAKADVARVAATRTAVKHTLLLDFEDLRADRERSERADLEAAEAAARKATVVQPEQDERNRLLQDFARELNAILAELERRRVAAEAEAERQRQERLRREEAAREAEERRKRDADEAERKRLLAEKEAKAAEKRRKDEEKRKAAQKLKAERDAATRGGATGGGPDASSQPPQRPPADPQMLAAAAAARTARVGRMHAAIPKYAATFEAAATEATTADDWQQLAERVCAETCADGGLLFHTSLYIGLAVDATTPANGFRVVAASANSSEDLRRGGVTVTDKQAPTSIAACLEQRKPTDVIAFSDGAVVTSDQALAVITSSRGGLGDLGVGQFFAAPIVSEDGATSYGLIAIDTASEAQRDPAATLHMPQEEALYDEDGRLAPVAGTPATSDAVGASSALPITPQMQAFVIALGKALGAGYHRIHGPHTEGSDATASASMPPPVFNASGLNRCPDLLSLYAALARELSAKLPFANGDVYVSALNRPNGDSTTVMVHRGASIADPPAVRTASDCIGRTIATTAPSAESTTKAGGSPAPPHVAPSAPTFQLIKEAPRSLHIADVRSSSAVSYASGRALEANRGAQELLMLPLIPAADRQQSVVAIVGIGANRAADDAPSHFSAEVREAIEAFIHGDAVRGALKTLQRKALTTAIASQALDWITSTTGKDNAYVALRDEATGALTVVAASESQAWMLHKTWSDADGGVAHPFLAQCASAPAEGLVAHIADVSVPDPRFGDRPVKFFNDAITNPSEVKAQMLMAAVTLRQSDSPAHAGAPIWGVLCMDTVNSVPKSAKSSTRKAVEFAETDRELAKSTAYLLAEALADMDAPASSNDGRKMAVESVVDRSHLLFLSKVWNKVTIDIENLQATQINEIRSYNVVAKTISTVCGATLIVLGAKPSAVTTWENIRKKVTHDLIKKMISFDPTSKKVKKAFSVRAKKMTAGMTAGEVFTSGSYPVSCLFSWTFVVILLRKTADRLRKRAAAGTLGLGAVAAVDEGASSAATGDAGFNSDEANDGDGADEAADADGLELAEEEVTEN